ncbi:haloacid dehalogenase-like hydrolase, putative (HAD1) [Plasmodium ovale wallikeri]|uniref:Haloacid dehalogenase-like hydrolase, putative n=3 Tax=Plasmodium ovale TaxID=36330 RepID=A0A1C3KQ19_PLAOA|nr:haloacid dehalogenase-like hydrolase, putative (HAD1) [Plasmodium ovale wallikeri]SBT76166.1 haloacid dehalogenase-like hydrolase, putative [Plasmodium ovale]
MTITTNEGNKMLEIKDKNGENFEKKKLNDEIKIFFTDLDGTLLNSEHKISKFNLESLKKAKDKGIKIVIATGRPLFSAESIIGEDIKKTNLSLIPGIYLNGCITYDCNGNKIINHIINHKLKMEIYHFSKKENIIPYIIWYSLEKTFSFSMNDVIKDYMTVESITPEIIDDNKFKDIIIYKVLICLNQKNLNHVLKLYKNEFSHKINVANTFKTYIEMFHHNSNKFEGVKEICKSYNISINNALVIGDGENDIEMLQGVPNSVTLSNASDKVKECAKYIGPSNDDNAVHHVLHAFIDLKE